MRANGKTTCSMVTAKKAGLTALSTRANTWQAKNMAEEFTAGTMAHATTENGKKIRSRGSVHIHGLMVVNIVVNGSTITWMAWVYTHGRTAGATRESIRTTKSKGTAFTLGRTVACIRVTGGAANSTVSAVTQYRANPSSSGYGKKARE